MYQFTVSESTVSENRHLLPLLEELGRAKAQGVKLYFTYFEGEDDVGGDARENTFTSFTFITTSKQIHLGLGAMGWGAQLHLAWLLELEFQRHGYISQLLLHIDGGGILVTRTEEIDGTIVFTLAPAN